MSATVLASIGTWKYQCGPGEFTACRPQNPEFKQNRQKLLQSLQNTKVGDGIVQGPYHPSNKQTVQHVQRALNMLGLLDLTGRVAENGEPDGQFGDQTMKALRKLRDLSFTDPDNNKTKISQKDIAHLTQALQAMREDGTVPWNIIAAGQSRARQQTNNPETKAPQTRRRPPIQHTSPPPPPRPAVSRTRTPGSLPAVTQLRSIYRASRLAAHGLTENAFVEAMIARSNMMKKGRIRQTDQFTVIDYSHHENQSRLFVINGLGNGRIPSVPKLKYSAAFRHSPKSEDRSRPGYATKFSRYPGKMELGAAVTGSSVYALRGSYDSVLGLKGIDSTNNLRQDKVLHQDFRKDRSPYSNGCPSIFDNRVFTGAGRKTTVAELLKSISGKQGFYAYSPLSKYRPKRGDMGYLHQ